MDCGDIGAIYARCRRVSLSLERGEHVASWHSEEDDLLGAYRTGDCAHIVGFLLRYDKQRPDEFETDGANRSNRSKQ